MLRKAFSFLLAAVLGAALGVGGLLLWQRENPVDSGLSSGQDPSPSPGSAPSEEFMDKLGLIREQDVEELVRTGASTLAWREFPHFLRKGASGLLSNLSFPTVVEGELCTVEVFCEDLAYGRPDLVMLLSQEGETLKEYTSPEHPAYIPSTVTYEDKAFEEAGFPPGEAP